MNGSRMAVDQRTRVKRKGGEEYVKSKAKKF